MQEKYAKALEGTKEKKKFSALFTARFAVGAVAIAFFAATIVFGLVYSNVVENGGDFPAAVVYTLMALWVVSAAAYFALKIYSEIAFRNFLGKKTYEPEKAESEQNADENKDVQ